MNEIVAKKRKFGIPSSLSKGLTNTISMAENHVIDFKNAVIPLSYIELDPDNPRRMNVSIEDIKGELNVKDKNYAEKAKELEALKELAWSIEKKGLINPITVYQTGDKYRLVAGERRYLASTLAGKTEIEARIYKSIPNEKDLKLVQWIENTAREDLCLSDKLANIESIVGYFNEDNADQKFSVEVLMDLTGLAKSNAYLYLSILKNPTVRKFIESGDISSLRTAASLAEIKDSTKLAEIIELHKNGTSISSIMKLMKEQKKAVDDTNKKKIEKRGRTSTSINLGKVTHTKVIQVIVNALTENPSYSHVEKIFAGIDWSNTKEVTQSFKKLLSILEREV